MFFCAGQADHSRGASECVAAKARPPLVAMPVSPRGATANPGDSRTHVKVYHGAHIALFAGRSRPRDGPSRRHHGVDGASTWLLARFSRRQTPWRVAGARYDGLPLLVLVGMPSPAQLMATVRAAGLGGVAALYPAALLRAAGAFGAATLMAPVQPDRVIDVDELKGPQHLEEVVKSV
jgi:hypothetical protein